MSPTKTNPIQFKCSSPNLNFSFANHGEKIFWNLPTFHWKHGILEPSSLDLWCFLNFDSASSSRRPKKISSSQRPIRVTYHTNVHHPTGTVSQIHEDSTWEPYFLGSMGLVYLPLFTHMYDKNQLPMILYVGKYILRPMDAIG